jgi:hypothetical protein
MNYIVAKSDQLISVTSKEKKATDGNLALSLRDAIYLAKNIKCVVELTHELGSYLIDKNGKVEVLSGKVPDNKLLPLDI